MPSKRSKTGWRAPRTGGYSARSATTGRFVKESSTKKHPTSTVHERSDLAHKPAPPTSRGAASDPAPAHRESSA